MKTHLPSPELTQRAPHEWNAALEDDEEREAERDLPPTVVLLACREDNTANFPAYNVSSNVDDRAMLLTG